MTDKEKIAEVIRETLFKTVDEAQKKLEEAFPGEKIAIKSFEDKEEVTIGKYKVIITKEPVILDDDRKEE